MCTRKVTSRGVAICAIIVLVGFIRSVLVFQTQRSTDELRTGHAALAVPHPLHQYHNHFHHQLQLKIGELLDIQNFTTVRRPSSRPRRWFTHIDSQINKLLSEARINRYSGRSSFGRVDYYSQAGKHRVDHNQRLHTPSKLLHRRIQSISDHMMMTTDTLILGYFNAHHSLWYSSSTDSRGTMLESIVSGSNFGIQQLDFRAKC